MTLPHSHSTVSEASPTRAGSPSSRAGRSGLAPQTAGAFLSRSMAEEERNVWLTAWALTADALAGYGNVLSPAHLAAVKSVCSVFAGVCLGGVLGRYAVAMPTGAGKTLAAALFITALHRHGRPESVAVCCERVQQLLNFRTELLKWGVPEEKIGLWYSKGFHFADGTTPPIPSTTEPQKKQFLLLTHSRTLGQSAVEEMNVYAGAPRSLWVFDESLMASSHTSFLLDPLLSALHLLRGRVEGYKIRRDPNRAYRTREDETHKRLLQMVDGYVSTCVPILKAELTAQAQDRTHRPKALTMPALAPDLLTPMVPAFPHSMEAVPRSLREPIPAWDVALWRLWGRVQPWERGAVSMVRRFLRMRSQPIRVVGLEDAAVVTIALALPKSINRLVVLDASFPVRVLENIDRTITPITGFENLKDWSAVSLSIEQGASGREPVSRNFAETAAWAIAKINSYPDTDPVLVLTFKDRPDMDDSADHAEQRSYRKTETKMQAGFTKAVRLANVPNPERIQFLTFGNETSLSDYKHIPHVVFLGVLHRSDVDLAGAILGQTQNLRKAIGAGDVVDVKLGEQAHGIYQGLSRGTCRTIINGKASPMTVALRHHAPHALWSALKGVMPGCKPHLPVEKKESRDKAADIVALLTALLDAQNSGKRNITLQALKEPAGLTDMSPKSYSRLIEPALHCQGSLELPIPLRAVTGWRRELRSLIRMTADTFGFTATASK